MRILTRRHDLAVAEGDADRLFAHAGDIVGRPARLGRAAGLVHRLKRYRGAALILLVLFTFVGAVLFITPTILWIYAPNAVRAISLEQVSDQFFWRLQFYFEKATGQVPDLSWLEVIQGTWPGEVLKGSWPGSGFIMGTVVEDSRSLYADVRNPLTSPEDRARGQEIFLETCAPCHGKDGRGGAHAPSLARANFSVGSSDFALYKVLRDGIPGSAMAAADLSIAERWQVIAFLRSLDVDAENETAARSRIPPVNVSPEALLAARSRTDEWLTYSGSLDGWRHSQLREITAANVGGLKLRWAHQFATEEGTIEATPLVAGKTIFLTEPPNNVVALEAKTGREIWRYVRRVPRKLPVCCSRVNRGLAILGNRLFMGTLDARLVALDASSGEVLWEVKVADPSDGFTITGAPLIANNAVIVGVSGGEYGIRGFLAAYDPATGQQRWRFHTIPGPGEAGHDSWKNGAWRSGGGATWVTGSFDPALNLIYWGVGNPAPVYAGELRPGDNLFTNSVIALDATTGKLAWHFQFTPHGQHDWDSAQTPVLADLTIDGVARKVICWANRNGFYYVLDRTTGQFLRGVPFVKVNWASGLDHDGRPILTAAAEVTTRGVLARPGVGGGTNWQPPSYDPQSQTFLVHAAEGASVYTKARTSQVRRGPSGLYVGSGSSNAGPSVNVVKALDAATGAIKWEHASPRQQMGHDRSSSGVLSTAGGIAFSASSGVLFALDLTTGKELWRASLGGRTQATPISFLLDGHQVVAVAAGRAFFMFGL
jgi:alcohol dehydrogenase (cytochrome c)